MPRLIHNLGSVFRLRVATTNPLRWTATNLAVVLSQQETGDRVVLQYVVGDGKLQPDGSVIYEEDEDWSKANLPAGTWELHLYEGTTPQRECLFPEPVNIIVVTPTGGDLTVGT